MCLICAQLKEGILTSKEARRNMGEMHEVLEKKHRIEVLRHIWRAEDKECELMCEGSD